MTNPIGAIWRKATTWCWILRSAKGRKRRNVHTAAEVAEKFQLKPAERDAAREKIGPVDPGRHEPGYDARTGTTIHPDAEVLTPYIGSEQEEAEAAKPILPRKSQKKKFGPYTCTTCLGWGCERCRGKGWV